MSNVFQKTDLAKLPTELMPLGMHAYARLAGGNPNSGFVIGSDGVAVIDAAATPALARAQLRSIRQLTDAPIRYVLLTHYHAIRVLGASIYLEEGAQIVATRGTKELIRERGREDMESEMTRFAALFPEPETVKGLVWPTITFDSAMDVSLGDVEVQFLHLGQGHTAGDAIAWLPEERICFAGDLVEMEAGVYAGDAHLQDWLQTLERLRALEPKTLVPGRGVALTTPDAVEQAFRFTEEWVAAVLQATRAASAAGWDFKRAYDEARLRLDPKYSGVLGYEHCVAYAVARGYDECRGLPPKIWTQQEDDLMRSTLPGVL